jgi:hypothetical protein
VRRGTAGSACTLQRVECPKSFWTVSTPYRGLPIHQPRAKDRKRVQENCFNLNVKHVQQHCFDLNVNPSLMQQSSDEDEHEPLVPHIRYVDHETIQGPGAVRHGKGLKRDFEASRCQWTGGPDSDRKLEVEGSRAEPRHSLWTQAEVANH